MDINHMSVLALSVGTSSDVIAKTSPGTVAMRYAQRAAIAADPKFKKGAYDPIDPPLDGMRTARTIGLISYLSRKGKVEGQQHIDSSAW